MTATHNTGVSGLGYGQVIFSSLLFPPPQQCPPVDGMHGARVGNSTATQRQRSNAGSGTPMLVGQQQLAQGLRVEAFKPFHSIQSLKLWLNPWVPILFILEVPYSKTGFHRGRRCRAFEDKDNRKSRVSPGHKMLSWKMPAGKPPCHTRLCQAA
eukprot:1160767-Pelagomonas_calceolata.AAC.2